MNENNVSIHGHCHLDEYGAIIPPIYLSVVYEYIDYEKKLAVFNDRGYYVRYSREENPTVRALERILAKLEEGFDALSFNTGMSAIMTLLLRVIKPGSKVIVPYEVYGGTLALLENLAGRIGFKLVKVWPSAESILEAVNNENEPVIVFTEVLTNPMLRVIDLEVLFKELGENTILIVDNTFTTPLLVKPLKYGARYVVHSLTKYIAGHNDVLGGIVVSKGKDEELWNWRSLAGTILQPFEAYMTMRGLKTLGLRFEKQSRTALEIAEYLSGHSRVEEVYYPGLKTSPYYSVANKLFERKLYGGVLSFRIKGGYEEAVEFMKKLRVIKRAPSLGGTESMAMLPSKAASMHIPVDIRAKLGIVDNLVRLSIGLEDKEVLIEDIDKALG